MNLFYSKAFYENLLVGLQTTQVLIKSIFALKIRNDCENLFKRVYGKTILPPYIEV